MASALSFSLSSVVGKDLLGSLGAVSLLLWRFSLSSAALWAALWVWRRRGGPDPRSVPWRPVLALGLLLGGLVFIGFLALERLDASVYIVLVYLYPGFVVLGSAALGRPLQRLTIVALAVISVGVVLTVPDVFTGVDGISVAGVLLALGQAVSFAVYLIVNERVVPAGSDGVVMAAWSNLGAAVFFVPLAAVDGVTVPDRPLLVLEVVLFALIPTVAATTTFFRALRHLDPGVLAMIMTLEVALAIVWSALFLGERITAVEALGATVVIVGVVLAQRAEPVVEDTVPTGI
ncbi:MAG: DMT family transporter [Ilumatobacteraceae bacterium]